MKANIGVCVFLHIFSCIFSSCKCQTEGEIRLAAGFSTRSGRVEIFYSGEWGTVCDDSWDEVDADVVCRQLGFDRGATALSSAAFERGVGPIWLDQVGCTGNEASIVNCSNNGWGSHDCSHGEDASVICGDIRLAGGSSPNVGRVEVYFDQQWGTVCDDGWSDVDAAVVCHQLGLNNGARAYSNAHFGQGSGPVWLDSVECSGNEDSLTNCTNPVWAVNVCSHSEDAGVVCGRIRLVGGDLTNRGRVEVLHNSQWGTICDDLWDELDATVVCRQLGFETGVTAVGEATFGKGSGPIWLDNIQCAGNETLIEDCSRNDWGVENCEHTEDAGVICSDIRLSGGSLFIEGRVEVHHDGIWGTVCDANWDDTDASVVCRQLGYSKTGTALHHADYGRLDSTYIGRTWLDDVKCRGNESSLLDCEHSGWGVSDCAIIKEAGVICKNGASICSLKPCLNGGFCVEQSYGYICVCLNGFEGENCEIEISPNLQGNPDGSNLVAVVVINTTFNFLLLGVIILLVIWVRRRQRTASSATSLTADKKQACVEMQSRYVEKSPPDGCKHYYKEEYEPLGKTVEEDDVYEVDQIYDNC